MGDPTLEVPSPERASNERLDSWKEIASYLNRDVTTVQRWEKREGMPVHRHLHDKRGSVYALSTELDAWILGRKVANEEENRTPETNGDVTEVSVGGRTAFFASWMLLVPLATVLVVLGVAVLLEKKEFFWRNPIASASFHTLTDFDGVRGAAAISRDGQFVVFLSDRDGQTDVWVTQLGSGQFHNLTHGSVKELLNPSVRTLGFSPDGSLVNFWARKPGGSGETIGIWSVPTLGGEIKQYLDGAAELDWSHDGSRLAYHTWSPGDPLFVSDGNRRTNDRALFSAAGGVHCHFPTWSQDGKYIYFVMSASPERWDIWRIRATGGSPERITSQDSRTSYPVLLDDRTLLYLAADSDGSGPWLYEMDVSHRIPHRLNYGIEKYTSLAATSDGKHLVATLTLPKRSLWRMSLADSKQVPEPVSVSIPTSNGFLPRLGPGYLLYVSATGSGESIWKLAAGKGTKLWTGDGAHLSGTPAISADGNQVAFAVQQKDKSVLFVMKADGTGTRILSDSLLLRGAPAWTPDGTAITIAADQDGTPHLYRIPVSGQPIAPLVREYSTDPTWSADGSFVIYSGPDLGTQFAVRAMNADGTEHALPSLSLTRGGRHIAVIANGRELAYLSGDLQHKDLWLFDPASGSQRRLTTFGSEFNVTGFDVSADGREIIFERTEESSQIVMLDRTPK